MSVSIERSSRLILPVLALSITVLLTGCGFQMPGSKKDGADANKPKEQAIPVEVAAIGRGSIESTYKTSNFLDAEEQVRVLARTSNRVKDILAEEGDVVKKDQVLARLEDLEQRTALEKAKNQLEKMRSEFDRVKKLFEQKLISEKDYTDIKFEVRQLELTVDEAQRQLDFTEIRAPIDGTVSQRLIKLGDLVSNNQHLFDIVDFNTLVVEVAVPDKNLVGLRVDQPVRIGTTAIPGQHFSGFVKRISPIVHRGSGSVVVTVGVRSSPLLRPGMYVEAEIVLATKTDALLISKRALVYDGDQFFVYRLKDDRRVERLLLEPAMADKDNIEPAQGFAEGDQIVIAGQTGLKHNALVRLPGDPEPDKDDKKSDAKTPVASDKNGSSSNS